MSLQVIERLMELISPFLSWPWWHRQHGATDSVAVAELKADRSAVSLGVTSVLGVAASFLFGLDFLQGVGISGVEKPSTCSSPV